ncbi:MAG: hypothetical protein PVF58_18410 [Candidatus Methanofastidiosia archaeon]|jgi:hypothetical protein
MNERHEERQQRSGERGRGPKIVSIQEPEPEERAPPRPPVREYPPEQRRRTEIPPSEVGEPKKESRKGILLAAIVIILILSNLALIGLHMKQGAKIEELGSSIVDLETKIEVLEAGIENLVSRIDGITENFSSLRGEQIKRKLDDILSKIRVTPVSNDLTVTQNLEIDIRGLTSDVFSRHGMKPDDVTIEVVISKDGQESAKKNIGIGIPQIIVTPQELSGEGTYEVLLRITYQEIMRDELRATITIKRE